MDIKDNHFMSDNAIASNNQINVETRGAIETLFENTLELICMPKEKFKQIKSGLIVKQIENCQKILIKTKEIKDKFDIRVIPPPLKFSIPFMKQAACEHEEEMYDLWAKLLVEAATDYNPIQLQYADILSKISSSEAKLLKEVYQNQKQCGGNLLEIKYIQSQGTELVRGYNLLTARLEGDSLYLNDSFPTNFEFIFPYYIEANPKPNTIDTLQQDVIQKDFEKKIITSVNLLVQLNLIHKKYTVSHNRYNDSCYAISKIGMVLTEFGYSMIDCLERTHNATEELSK